MGELLLNNNQYFSNLEGDELDRLQKIILKRSYKKGEVIFFEEEEGEGLFLLQSGKVKLTKMVKNGEEQILTILKSGEIFAEVVLFDKRSYPATAIAIEDTELGLIRRDDMKSLIKEYPTIALKMMGLMSKRLRRAQKLVRDMGVKDTKARVASLLIYLAKEHGIKDEGKLELNLKLTQRELASMVGTSRETISRILNKFKEKKLIVVSRRRIIIKELNGLKELI